MSTTTVNRKSFSEYLPKEIQSLILGETVDLKTFISARQVSKLWNEFLSEPNTLETFVQKSLYIIYEQDPFNRKIEDFFIKNIEIIKSEDPTSVPKVRTAFNELCSISFLDPYEKNDHVQESQRCTELRWFLWKTLIRKKPELLNIEKEIDFIRKSIDDQFKQATFASHAQPQCSFDLLHNCLRKKIIYNAQRMDSVWRNCCLPLCSLVLSLGLVVNENEQKIILETILLKSSYYNKKINNSKEIAKPLRLNIPFILQLLISQGVNIKKHVYSSNPDDYSKTTYFHKLITYMDYIKVFRKEERDEAKEICVKNRNLLTEIGHILLQNGVDICHGNMLQAGRMDNPELTFYIIKKHVDIHKSKRAIGNFNMLANREMTDPKIAKNILIYLKNEHISMKEVKSDENDNLLYEVIEHITTFLERDIAAIKRENCQQQIDTELWNHQWIDVAILLMSMGENPMVTPENTRYTKTIPGGGQLKLSPLVLAQQRLREEQLLLQGLVEKEPGYFQRIKHVETTPLPSPKQKCLEELILLFKECFENSSSIQEKALQIIQSA